MTGCAPASELLVLGGGSAAFAAALRARELGARVTLVNAGLPIGGTCVNVGCVPSKALVRAGEARARAIRPRIPGLRSRGVETDFPAVVQAEQELVRELRQRKYGDLACADPGIRIVEGRGRFVDPHTVVVNGEHRLRAERVVVATGARPRVPEIQGLAEVRPLTHEQAFALDRLPESLLVVGGRYVALECAQAFARLGARVTILQRSERILPQEAPDLTERLAAYLAEDGLRILTGCSIEKVWRAGPAVRARVRQRGEITELEASEILVAAGRTPNTEELGLEAAGVAVDPSGFVVVDETLRTTAEHVHAAGDVIGEPMFVYTAAYEGALAAANAITGGGERRDYGPLPWVIFTDPQAAGVGLDLASARRQGHDAESSRVDLDQVPRSLAACDTRGFVELVRDRASDRLLGARILAPEGGELTMPIALAMRRGVRCAELARMLFPYLTLVEAIKLAALGFEKDVDRLSCCAS